MSVQRPDPLKDASAVREATAGLIEAVAALGPAAAAEPSLLPGWTRAHVLTHLARQADAMVNLLTWARTGVETPMYAGEEAREKDIEDGAGRPLDELLDDLRLTGDRFAMAVEDMSPKDWAAQVRTRQGTVLPAAEVPARRLAEIHIHRVDLGIGTAFADLPAEFVSRELGVLIDRLSGREGIAAVRLRDAESGTAWDIGAAGEPEVTVTGPRSALLAWLTGRSGGAGLAAEPAMPLPVLPPLG